MPESVPADRDSRPLRQALPLALLSLGLASVFESLVTLEWWYPACGVAGDGPAAAVFGLPLPYVRFSGVSSMTYDFMPHVMALDVLLLAAMILVPLAAVVSRLSQQRARRVRLLAWALGATLTTARLGWLALLLSVGSFRPVVSIGLPPYLSYAELRPLRLVSSWHYDCQP
jgi:hypothetical protein